MLECVDDHDYPIPNPTESAKNEFDSWFRDDINRRLLQDSDRAKDADELSLCMKELGTKLMLVCIPELLDIELAPKDGSYTDSRIQRNSGWMYPLFVAAFDAWWQPRHTGLTWRNRGHFFVVLQHHVCLIRNNPRFMAQRRQDVLWTSSPR